MNVLMRRVLSWLDHRTGLETAIRDFLYEDIPGSSGWHQVFGSVAMFLFMVQAFTGVLLAFNYAPTPGDAYNSLKYIVTEVTGGSLIHGLHHWGASMLIVVVVLHMTQVFVFGAYKKPREATWMVGVCLLLITLAFGLTGYLLPWDNRAYWGTVVSTQIAAQAPLLGPYLSRLLGSTGSVGVVTFARFYALHVLILPPLTTFLIIFHVFLVRKHGVTPTPGDIAPPKKFFPEQVLKDVVAVFTAFVVLYSMALFVSVPLERLADPTDLTYIPRPDWYFLFLFQTLKFFKGALEPVGTVVLPNLAILALFLTPFVDRGKLDEVHTAHHGHRCGRVCRHRLGRAHLRRHQNHAAVARAGSEHARPIGKLESVLAPGACGTGLLPPGEVPGLPQSDGRRAQTRSRSGHGACAQGRRMVDQTLQEPQSGRARQQHASHRAER